jgi:hypothetical protein
VKRYYVEIESAYWIMDPAIVEKYLCAFKDNLSRVKRLPFSGLEIIEEEVDEGGL